MRLGDRRKRLLLQQRVQVTDADGNLLYDWQDVGYFWAQIEVPSVLAASGARGERQQAGQDEQLRPWTLNMLATPTLKQIVNHNTRFKLDGNRILDVRSVTDLGELHKTLRINVMEKVY